MFLAYYLSFLVFSILVLLNLVFVKRIEQLVDVCAI